MVTSPEILPELPLSKCRCSDCGLLAAWVGDEMVEINYISRYRAELSKEAKPIPYCLALVEEYVRETEDLLGGMTAHEVATHVMHEDRECVDFIKYRAGFSPKEHVNLGMLAEERRRTERLVREQRLYEKSRDDAQRTYLERCRYGDRIWQVIVGVVGIAIGAALAYLGLK